MNNIYLSVIIPAYNEEKTIVNTLRSVINYLEKQDFQSEILVVSDGSKDKTAEIIKSLPRSDLERIFVIARKENRGKGYSVREGMLKAKGEIRLFTDADNSTDISHFDLMKPYFLPAQSGYASGYDIVIGSRDAKDAKGARQAVPQKWHKRMLGNFGNLFIQFMAVPGIWDTQCGFKAFTAKAAEKIFSKAKVNRFAFDIEALALARLFKYKIAIIPVHWINNPYSRVKLSTYLEVLWETVKIRRYIKQLKKSKIIS